ncbi:MAG: methylamine dehydrogenase (amicyanin) small subunit [Steroidobacterales bacterium]
MANFDQLAEKMVRGVASRTSRRSLFGMLGTLLAGAASLPLLPVARAEGAEPGANPASGKDSPVSSGNPQDPGDQTSCDYWRYCAIDGSLCSCYGGSVTSCPPGLEMSPITWIGTCRNPADDRNYIVSYNDCCGGVAQGRCSCQRNEGDRPVVRPQNNNEITWCFGTKSQSYTCTVAIILGVATDQK